jgi:hypothetical protein
MGRPWMGEIIGFVIPIVAIAAWALMRIVSTVMQSRVRELEVRERIAMIEKGLVPPPEVDPVGFDRELSRRDRGISDSGSRGISESSYRSSCRHRRIGVTVAFVGLGLMVMLYPSFRVGGFLLVLGIGFLVNSLLFERTPPDPPRPS